MEQEIQEDVEKYILSFYDDNPFVQYLHMDILNIGSGEVRLALQVVHEHTNVYKIAHGGVLMSMGDTAMGAACLSCRKRVVTLDFHMNFIRAVPTGQQVIARGRVVHNGVVHREHFKTAEAAYEWCCATRERLHGEFHRHS